MKLMHKKVDIFLKPVAKKKNEIKFYCTINISCCCVPACAAEH